MHFLPKISKRQSHILPGLRIVKRFRPVLTILVVMILAAGCAAIRPVDLPPLPSSASLHQTQPGEFIWIDLLSEDVVSAASFYSRLFGWQAARSDADAAYYLFSMNGQPVAGMAAAQNTDDNQSESLWLLTLLVDSVEGAVAAVRAQGGSVLEGPYDTRGRGQMVLVSDPAGAPLILSDSTGGGIGESPREGEWLWADLISRNPGRTAGFYSALAGYRTERLLLKGGHKYTIFKRKNRIAAGVVEIPWDGLADNWLPYFSVADLDGTIDRTRSLGGQLVIKSGDAAVLADPTGAVFGIQMQGGD